MVDARARISVARLTSNKHDPCDDLMKARRKLGLPCKEALLGRPTEITHPTGSDVAEPAPAQGLRTLTVGTVVTVGLRPMASSRGNDVSSLKQSERR